MHKDICYLNRTGIFHTHESELKKQATKIAHDFTFACVQYNPSLRDCILFFP